MSTEQQLPASSTPLCVAIDIAPLLSPLTGIGAAVQQLTLALAKDDRVSLMPYACSFRGHLGSGATRLPLPAFVAQRLWARAGWPGVDRWLGQPQVIHGTNYTVPPSRLPEVVTVYDCWFLRNPEQANGDVARAGRVLRRAVARGATVHASSNATADAVRELLHTERVEVIALAPLPLPMADDSAAPVAELVGAPYVLALGTLERRKNLPRLVAAFDQIAAADPDVRLVLAGSDGDDRDAINAAIDALHPKARERVLFTGRIDDGAKRWLLRHAQVLAYPSLDEGFGFPLLEAMGYNVPVVASTAGSIPEVAGDAAVLVAPHDVGALAEALQRTLTDSSLRTQLTNAGQARLKHYSWAQTATSLIELYSRVVDEARP